MNNFDVGDYKFKLLYTNTGRFWDVKCRNTGRFWDANCRNTGRFWDVYCRNTGRFWDVKCRNTVLCGEMCAMIRPVDEFFSTLSFLLKSMPEWSFQSDGFC